MKEFILAATALSLVACTSGVSELPQDPRQVEIDAMAEIWLAEADVPSVAIAWIEQGEIAWTAVYGERAPDTAATSDTLYNIASMTKPVTAETVLRLASDGRLSLDDRMADWWTDPDIADDPRRLALTPQIALRHQTGFPNWRDDRLTFNFEPGTDTAYSGEGYEYVARFAAARTGEPFEALAQKVVFDPIGMSSASYVVRDGMEERAALPYGPEGVWGEPVLREEMNAADDVVLTVSDYAAFMVSVMKGEGISGEIAANRFEFEGNVFANGCPWERCPESAGFAMGWTVFRYANETVVMHGGGDWGERTLGFFVPERNIGAVIFTNGANGSQLIRDVAGVLYPGSDFLEFLAFQAR